MTTSAPSSTRELRLRFFQSPHRALNRRQGVSWYESQDIGDVSELDAEDVFDLVGLFLSNAVRPKASWPQALTFTCVELQGDGEGLPADLRELKGHSLVFTLTGGLILGRKNEMLLPDDSLTISIPAKLYMPESHPRVIQATIAHQGRPFLIIGPRIRLSVPCVRRLLGHRCSCGGIKHLWNTRLIQ